MILCRSLSIRAGQHCAFPNALQHQTKMPACVKTMQGSPHILNSNTEMPLGRSSHHSQRIVGWLLRTSTPANIVFTTRPSIVRFEYTHRARSQNCRLPQAKILDIGARAGRFVTLLPDAMCLEVDASHLFERRDVYLVLLKVLRNIVARCALP
jgi:hypothetical protein